MSSNKRKSEKLGMPFGTAQHRLRKNIIFELAERLSLTRCYRCETLIMRVEDLSIEHKDSWEKAPHPQKLFFDLDNIAFSHVNCNSRNGRKYMVPENTITCPNCRKDRQVGKTAYKNFKAGRKSGHCHSCAVSRK